MRVKPTLLFIVLFGLLQISSTAAQTGTAPPETATLPNWLRRGLPGEGHAALAPLIGTWRVRYEIHGTLGRRGDEPPIVSEQIRATRKWVGGGRFVEDTTTGVIDGEQYWRRGWLGYSNMDERYEWTTIDAINTTMMTYVGAPGSGSARPIVMTGAFTDQGVAGEDTVGRRIDMRTVIRIHDHDNHVFELYFTRPGAVEVLALRSTYKRVS